MVIHRVTMFKIPNSKDQETLLNQYRTLSKTAVKDGKPYILTLSAGAAGEDSRNRGWNLAIKSTFATKADLDFYDNDCVAHKELKGVAGPIKEDVMTVWWEEQVEASM